MSGLVSVVIPNLNKKELLQSCLQSLAAQDYPDMEIIVVDNGSTDGAPDMVGDEFPDVRLIRFDWNRGFSAAVNAGIDASSGRLVALINNDADADLRWLSELVAASERHPDAGFFASKILLYSDKQTIDTFGDGFTAAGFGYKRGWGEASEKYGKEEGVFGACGGAAMYRMSMLRDIIVHGEYFDKDFFAYGEDLDLSLRANLFGYRCIAVPSAVVYHRMRATGGRGAELPLFLSHRNFMLAVMKNFPAVLILKNLFNIACFLLLAAAVDVLQNRRLLYPRSYLAALKMWPAMKEKRRMIQSAKRVNASSFSQLLTGGWFFLWLKLGRMSRLVREKNL